MQPAAILQRAFPIFRNDHCLRYTVDSHPVSDRGREYDGWIIRAHFASLYDPTPVVAYARIDRGYVAFSHAHDVTRRPFHHGPGSPWPWWPEWSREIISEADWRHFADHAPHYTEQPVDRLRDMCAQATGRPHGAITQTPEWRLVGWLPVVDRDGNLTGEVIEGSHLVSWYRLDQQAHCVVMESHGDHRNRLEEEELQAILGPEGAVNRHSDSIEMTIGGLVGWGNNPRHAIEVAHWLRREHDAVPEPAPCQ